MNAEDDIASIIKKYAGIVVFISLTFSFLYWFYQNIINEGSTASNNGNNQSIQTSSSSATVKRKNKMTISLQRIFPIFSTDFEKGVVYQILDQLSNEYDLFFIILITDNDDKEAILNKFSVLIEDIIIYQHVSNIFFMISNREYYSVQQ